MSEQKKTGLKQVTKEDLLNHENNPGLDADHSSSGEFLSADLDNDNDRISKNPDGEEDIDGVTGFSPLDEK